MYSKIKRVHAITSKKNIHSVYASIWINNGLILSTDGSMTIGVTEPELEDIQAIVPADKLLKALAAMKNPKFHTTDINLMIKEGRLSVRLPLMKDVVFPLVQPTGMPLECSGVMQALSAVAPFISNDASHKWATGCMIKDNYVYATNNIVIVRHKVVFEGEPINIPNKAVTELVRKNEEPIAIIQRPGAITFMFEDDSWLDTALVDYEWPNVSAMFTHADLPVIHAEIKDAVDTVSDFCKPPIPKIYFGPDGISTEESEVSSSYGGIELPVACFHANTLNQVLPYIECVDWSEYPKPCPFTGRNGLLQGLVVGIRI